MELCIYRNGEMIKQSIHAVTETRQSCRCIQLQMVSVSGESVGLYLNAVTGEQIELYVYAVTRNSVVIICMCMFEKSLYCFEILFNQTLIKSLSGTKILSFYEVFNSLSLCFVYLVLFYKPFQTFIYIVESKTNLYIYIQGVDVVEWSMALDVRLSEWCCSVTMVWVQIPSREEQKFDSSKI